MLLFLVALVLVTAGPGAPAGAQEAGRIPDGAPEARRIYAIADIHGALDSITAILQEIGLVDDELRWSGGDSVLVQTGDILDRGPEVRACMDLLMRLQDEAAAAGGRIIVLLGNHEGMNLVGYWRDTTPADTAAFVDEGSERRRDEAYQRWTELHTELAAARDQPPPQFDRQAWNEAHPLGYVERMEALGPEGRYGRWLRSLPTAARLDDVLFMHAGLHPDYADLGLDEINELVASEVSRFDETREMMVARGLITPHADLVEMITAADEQLVVMIERMQETGERPDREGQELARALGWVLEYTDWQLLARDGLLWFRGLAEWDEATRTPDVEALLDKQGIEHIVVGHTTQADGTVRSRFGGRVFLNDTGMLTEHYHGRPAALEIAGGTFTARYLGDSTILLRADPGGDVPPRPPDLSEIREASASGPTPRDAHPTVTR